MEHAAGTADLARQLDRLQADAALCWLDDRALLAARGADRASFLQGMLSNEVGKLAPGEGNRALLLTEQGRVVAELRVYALDGELWLDVATRARAAVREALERFIVADDVELEERPACALAVLGPRAAERLGALVPESASALAALGDDGHAAIEVAGVALRAARSRLLAGDGFHLWAADRPAAERVAAHLREGGIELASPAALEVLRVARGIAREGIDFDERTLAPEVPSLAGAISYRKGCYLGQEVVERVAARGHVNWRIAAVRANDRTAEVLPGSAVSRDGKEIGQVTSAARLPDGETIAMLARIRTTAAEPDALVSVAAGDVSLAARVVAEPR